MLKQNAAILVALIASNFSGDALAQDRTDIVQIWQNFVASRKAALGCDTTSKDSDVHFLANYQDVTIRAQQTLGDRNPNLSAYSINAKMKEAEAAIDGKVENEISANGCSSAKIQQLLALYKMHSTMRL